jgi:hypothetical protein
MAMILKITTKLSFILMFLFFLSCSSSPTNDDKILEPDPRKRAAENAAKGGGIFGDINNRKKGSTTFEFASSNILWRATLKSLEFLPLINADYSGGVIIYDWYSQNNNPNEQIKVTVRFLDAELKANSIKITAHKKICNSSAVCSNSSLDEKFSSSIQESILASARIMKIEEAKKEKK